MHKALFLHHLFNWRKLGFDELGPQAGARSSFITVLHQVHWCVWERQTDTETAWERERERERERVIRKNLLVFVHSRVWKLLSLWTADSFTLMLLVGHLRACLLSFFPLFLRSECLVSYTGRENDSFFCYHSIASSRKNLAISTSPLVATFVFPTIACKLSSLIHCQNCFSLELSRSCWSGERFES